MPFFSRNSDPEPEVVHVDEAPQKRSLFGSKRDSSSPTTSTHNSRLSRGSRHSVSPPPAAAAHHSSGGGIFRRSTDATSTSRRSIGSTSTGMSSGGVGGLLRRHGDGDMDPSIIQARERVMGAETAEREADRALDVARHEVREARDQVRKLELEAKEEARRAKIKAFHAKEVSKRGKALGRHDI